MLTSAVVNTALWPCGPQPCAQTPDRSGSPYLPKVCSTTPRHSSVPSFLPFPAAMSAPGRGLLSPGASVSPPVAPALVLGQVVWPLPVIQGGLCGFARLWGCSPISHPQPHSRLRHCPQYSVLHSHTGTLASDPAGQGGAGHREPPVGPSWLLLQLPTPELGALFPNPSRHLPQSLLPMWGPGGAPPHVDLQAQRSFGQSLRAPGHRAEVKGR